MSTELNFNEHESAKAELSELCHRKSILEGKIKEIRDEMEPNQGQWGHAGFMESQLDVSPLSLIKAFGSFLLDQFSFKR